ncbi:MAG: hypothetical protein FJW20_03785 [Acidimicrobiia bacterium]|nr:hypothetical protein [Acidimicrobiia bacterium]
MRLTALLVALAAAALAQPSAPAGPAVRSPEVHPDCRVTFRLLAPKATEVTLRGEWMEGPGRLSLTKGEDGVWSLTVGPLPADLYSYSFQVDGLQVLDPRNPLVKLGATASNNSLVDIPGERVAFHAIRDVPHGTVHVHHYMSKPAAAVLAKPEETNKKLRLFWISCGKTDFLLLSVEALLESLNKHNIRHTWRPTQGGHTWTNWRFYLAEFLPLLFSAS